MSDPEKIRADALREARRDLAKRLVIPVIVLMIGVGLVVYGVIEGWPS